QEEAAAWALAEAEAAACAQADAEAAARAQAEAEAAARAQAEAEAAARAQAEAEAAARAQAEAEAAARAQAEAEAAAAAQAQAEAEAAAQAQAAAAAQQPEAEAAAQQTEAGNEVEQAPLPETIPDETDTPVPETGTEAAASETEPDETVVSAEANETALEQMTEESAPGEFVMPENEEAESPDSDEVITEWDEEEVAFEAALAGGDGESTEKPTEAVTEKQTETEIPEGKATIISTVGTDGKEKASDDDPAYFKNDSVVTGKDIVEGFKNAIQKAIEDLFATLTEAVKSATIEVDAGTYDGDIEIDAENLPLSINADTFKDNFILNIIAKATTRERDGNTNAPKDGTVQADADDSVNVKGNVVIKGINVLMAGLKFAADKTISVENGNLDLYGTAKDDTLNLELGKDSSVKVVSGDGDDTVKTKISEDSKADITTGGGNDKVEVDAQVGSKELKVDTGEGNDTVSLKASGTADADKGTQTATITTGAGKDQVNLDISAADVFDTINLDAGDGDDRLHLTGELKKDESERITGDASGLVIKNKHYEKVTTEGAKSPGLLNLTLTSVDRFTDELSNKEKVELKYEEGKEGNTLKKTADGTYVYEGGAAAFTDYVLKLNTSDIQSLSMAGLDGQTSSAFLTNLIIDSGETGEGSSLKIRNLNAAGMNVNMTASTSGTINKTAQIDILGTVIARNLIVKAVSGSDDDLKLKAEMIFDGDELASFFKQAVSDLFNVKNTAVVNIGKDAVIYSEGDIDISAEAKQKGSIIKLPDTSDLQIGNLADVNNMTNLVNVKVGTAKINVDDKLYAGYKADGSKSGLDGSITMKTDVNSNADTGSNNAWLSSLAVGVIVDESVFNLNSGAQL
ncbi:MAG: hypothetical protein J6S83_06705, partial [Lachnospiraceae bacterium]|nr:hypothetical protein [Lachnospiraceae bacterium]